MGCVNSNTSKQPLRPANQNPPANVQPPQPAKQPLVESPPPKQIPEDRHNAYPQIHQSANQKPVAVGSSFQNPAITKPPSNIPAVPPSGINPPSDHPHQIREQDIKIGGAQGSGMVEKGPAFPPSGIVESYISDTEKRQTELKVVEEQVNQQFPYVREQAEQHLKEVREEEDVVHSEGATNFTPPVRNINFHIQIS